MRRHDTTKKKMREKKRSERPSEVARAGVCVHFFIYLAYIHAHSSTRCHADKCCKRSEASHALCIHLSGRISVKFRFEEVRERERERERGAFVQLLFERERDESVERKRAKGQFNYGGI